jgi:hypothetical protein
MANAPQRWCSRTTRRWRRSSTASSRVLPAQRGRVLHLVLRLLPARSVRPLERHVHREGRLDQRGHRPAAAARHVESLMEREDVVIVATVSRSTASAIRCPTASDGALQRGAAASARRHPAALVRIQYLRNDVAFERGTFRVRGDTVEILPAYEEQGVRIELWGDEIERISKIDPAHGRHDRHARAHAAIYPAKHFVTSAPRSSAPSKAIRASWPSGWPSCGWRASCSRRSGSSQRTNFDIEMMLEIGTCAGIENYSRTLSGRRGRAAGLPLRLLPRRLPRGGGRVARHAAAGARHVQRRPRAQADAGGVRLPPAERARQSPAGVRRVPALVPRLINVSATPGELELELSEGVVVEQVIRPTDCSIPRSSASGEGAGGRPAARDPLRERRASACSSPRSPSAWPRISPTTCSRWACACATCTPTSTRSSAWRSCAAAARRVRRAGGHQPAARGARHARGLARGDPRCRPGRVPAQRPLADPDHRARGAQCGTGARSCTPTASPARCSARSARPRAAARCSASTTSSTASRRAA